MMTEFHSGAGAAEPAEDERIWIRGLYMLLFILIYGVTEVVVIAVAVGQFGWNVAAEERNERLKRFGANLSEYIYQIVAYWTFARDEKPFPFSDWPAPPVPPEARHET